MPSPFTTTCDMAYATDSEVIVRTSDTPASTYYRVYFPYGSAIPKAMVLHYKRRGTYSRTRREISPYYRVTKRSQKIMDAAAAFVTNYRAEHAA